mmetsp:Transcript_23725/g.29178  ORF Transcript_23725/g.29178 Transcript_23725/m.29178 type:complete len:101 (-) Transcript_23725:183-485(-)
MIGPMSQEHGRICSPFLQSTTFLQSKIGFNNVNKAEQVDGTICHESLKIARHASKIKLRNRLDYLLKNVKRLVMEVGCLKPPSASSSQNGIDVDVNNVRN